MSDMKCPVCNSNLIITRLCDGIFPNPNKGKIDEIFCDECKMHGTDKLWQELTDSMKEHDLCHDALVERTKELDHTRKALDLAVDALNFYANKQHYKNEELDLYVYEYEDNNETGILDLDDGGQMENGKKARDALAEVKTALEQKEE